MNSVSISQVAVRILELESRHRRWSAVDREEWTDLVQSFVRLIRLEPKERRANVRVPCGLPIELVAPLGIRDGRILNVSHTGLLVEVSGVVHADTYRAHFRGLYRGASMPVDLIWKLNRPTGTLAGFKFSASTTPGCRKLWSSEVYYPSYVQLLRGLSNSADA